MPCRDEHAERDYAREVQARLDYVTALLCGLCQRVEAAGVGELLEEDGKVWVWWTQHQATDRLRCLAEALKVKQEALRARAYAKLTPEERAAVGL